MTRVFLADDQARMREWAGPNRLLQSAHADAALAVACVAAELRVVLDGLGLLTRPRAPDSMPAGIDICALPNALKRAGLVPTAQTIDDLARVRSSTAASGTAGRQVAYGAGHGLIGMHERAALYGRNRRIGREALVGHAVTADVPLSTVSV